MTETASLVIKVDSSGARTASRDLDRLTDQAGKSERVAHKMGKAWGTAIGLIGSAAVIGGIRAVIKATIEQERVTAQLEARLKSTGQAAGLTKGQLLDMAAGLQQVTTFGDEAIVEAQSLLLTFTKIGKDVFPQATETVLDMSTALGQGLKESAIQLGKALNDPIQGVTALRRVGVQLSESQEDLIKKFVESGRTAEAQRVILKELEVQMGGSARAARDTLGGAIEGLKNAFGDLLEGDSGGEGVKGTTKAINDLTDLMSSSATKQAFQTVVTGLLQGAAAAIQATNALAGYIGKYKEFLANRGFAPGDELNQLQARRDKLEQSKRTPIGFFSQDKIDAEIARVDEQIKAFPFRGVSGSATGSWEGQGGAVSGGGKDKKGKKGREAPDFAKKAADELRRLIELEDRARQSFEAMEAQLAGPLSEAAYRFSQAQKELNETAKTGAIDADRLAVAQANLREEYEEEVEAIKKALDPTAQLIESMKFELSLIGMTNVERAKAIALRYAEADATEKQRAEIAALAEETARAGEVEQMMQRFRNGAADALTDIVTGAKSAKDALKDFFDSMAEMITRAIADQWMEQLFSSKKGAGGGGGWLQGIFSALMGGANAKGNAFSGGMVTAFANGGIVDGPTMFPMSGGRAGLMGEAGPEAVMPLRRGRDGKLGVSGGGGTTNITINVPRNYEYRTAQQVAQESGAAVNRANRRNG